jgi:hypothetical protein
MFLKMSIMKVAKRIMESLLFGILFFQLKGIKYGLQL